MGKHMKRLSSIGLAVAAVLFVSTAHAINFVSFEGQFGGKGSGNGGFSNDIHLAFDKANNVYVSDTTNRMIQKLDANGGFVWQYPAADAEKLDVVLFNPGDVAVDMAGNVYVADMTVSPVPQDKATQPLYVYTPAVHKFGPNGAFVKTIAIDQLTGIPSSPVTPVKQIIDADGKYALAIQPSGFDRAVKIDVDPQGNLFVLDAERKSKQVVYKYSTEGERVATFGRYGAAAGEFDSPLDLAVGADGNVFVADTGNHRVVKFGNDGTPMTTFANRGYGSNEVTAPHYISATESNELFVKDDTNFVRRRLGPLGGASFAQSGAAWSASEIGYRQLYGDISRNPLDPTLTGEDALSLRLRRLEDLYLLDTEGTEQSALTDEAQKEAYRLQNTLYHTVMNRVLRFDLNGRHVNTASYRLDQLDEERHDLEFLAADRAGRIYLQDASDYTVHRYRLVGFTLSLNHVDALSSSQVMSATNDFIEDYEDIDEIADTEQTETVTNASSRLVLNYDVTPTFNLVFEEMFSFAGRDGDQDYPERIENAITFEDRNYDNDIYFGIRKITNPNPYRYKEMNLFATYSKGSSRIDTDALRQDLNKQAGRQEGDSSEAGFGLDWDLFRDVNLLLQYNIYDPAETSRNYTRSFFDLEGNLYQVLRTENQSKKVKGELNIRF
ncbi:MAG: NHL repeat-containing protein [Candidatus Poribacteria bacterium]|nr:NHL repeat-containing protein [Candidatus Poribacteria bacterium]